MATRPADPLTSTEWLLIDGTNLLHALSKSKVAAPQRALIGRLRGAVPVSIPIDVVFDGPAERGLRGERIASGLRVRYSGGRTADAVLLSLVDETRATDGPLGTAAILVVTDDRDLRHGLRGKGARTAGTAWLLGRLERADRSGSKPGAPGSIGQPGASVARHGTAARHATAAWPGTATTPGSDGRDPATDPEGDDERRWEPGRRATVKKGNPRRRPRHNPGHGG